MPVLEKDSEKNPETISLQDGLEFPEPVLPVPPDGGWGWVVVFASFMIHVFADGFTYTFGIFYVYILNYYRVSKSSASWIASILVGVTLGSGPISGTLVNRFGCRIVTIAGAFLASFSIFISIFAENVIILYLTIGLGTGLGFGLIYLPAIISVTGYFEKRRSFATGIAVCGSGLGTFIFSPISEHLIEIYSWKGALIILSGIMLNCAVFGALFRPLELETPLKKVRPLSRKENGIVSDDDLSHITKDNNVSLGDIPKIQWRMAKQVLKQPSFLDQLKINSHSAVPPHIVVDGEIPRNNSHSCLDSRLRQLNRSEGAHRLFASQPLLPQSIRQSASTGAFDTHELSGSRKGGISGSGLLNRRDIFYRGSLTNIEKYNQDPVSYRSSIIRTTDEETPSEKERAKVCGCVPCSRETRDTLNSLMDWSLLSDPVFLLFILSNFCTSIGFNAPYIFTVDRALESGIDSDRSSYLLSIVGISNTISRVGLGYISDKPWVNRLYLYNVALGLCGLGTCLSIWLTSFLGQVFYAAVFGSMSGAYVGLTSVVLVDLLGMEKLTNAFGVLLMFQGIASLIGPPLCGALYDMSGSYDYSFLLAGFMIFISGVMLFFIPCAKKVQARQETKRIVRQYSRA